MTIEIVDFPIKNGGSFHNYVSLPEGRNFSSIWNCGTFHFPTVFFTFQDLRQTTKKKTRQKIGVLRWGPMVLDRWVVDCCGLCSFPARKQRAGKGARKISQISGWGLDFLASFGLSSSPRRGFCEGFSP